MLDISKYRLYIRDVSLTDDELKMLIQDIINDIASSTYVFKEIVGFTIQPGIQEYNFASLMNMNEKVEEGEISSITIGSYSEDDILNFISNKEINDDNLIQIDKTFGVTLNTFLSVDNIAYVIKNNDDGFYNIIGCYKDFKHLGNGLFKYLIDIKEPREAVVINSVIPNIDNLDDKTELLLKKPIIEGLHYFGNTSMSSKDEQTRYNSWNRYNREKLGLVSRFPTMTNFK